MYENLQIEYLELDLCFFQNICTTSKEVHQYLEDDKNEQCLNPYNMSRNKKVQENVVAETQYPNNDKT